MTIRHHADDATLLAYAAGAVTEGFSLVIAAHLEGCARCRARVIDAETLGGELLGDLPAATLDQAGLAKVWARIASSESYSKPKQALERGDREIAEVLAAYLPGGLEGVHWRTLIPGIRQHVLTDLDSGNGAVRLMTIAPGTTIPHHTHGGSELTLVLSGSFADEIGHFGKGDLADLDSSIHHQPIADMSETCICLVATDERLRFTNVMSRMIQPFIGI